MEIIKYRKIFYIFSGLLVAASVLALVLWQLNFGIDFTGGTIMEINFLAERPSNDQIREKIKDVDLGSVVLQPTQDKGLILRFKNIDETVHQDILKKLASEQTPDKVLEETRFDSIGPAIGQELKVKAYWAIGLSLIAILIYIAWAFRKVSRPVASWKYGLAAILALFHDLLITIGVFSILGHFLNVEIDLAFIAALLTILGYSINDTIVVFDRIRENLKYSSWDDFEQTLDTSVNQTMARSINTTLTTLMPLFALYFIGGATLHWFALALIIGITLGAYSSIFQATPFLLWWIKKKK
ncbi:MAG: protein translocase subunit SecF [Candidatus Portnoybacteria bacterium CG06_land_8_20_14_3_00_39_12]|uniref:Protein-export membrane protein SecF n=2 Tax=Candidatus Portnoyibacteriota TaxID=1817913 RepID=A0A2M7UHM3_9BACT|nr:MAG: protein-export membrane protein SecF [Parcubacteria group bacterium CG1_02_40_25]PIU75130.1 MAG: protein translocase subunit SecF [Candidatus Portnoybacteria bacterium CG06_land_8_20_14_3_00_39_12]PIZ70753.1 MAG: protein translocase subunit SecF [Candidatus Portnoybacteria bacterium CG_4_10_14_0_2_um_filter_39_11]